MEYEINEFEDHYQYIIKSNEQLGFNIPFVLYVPKGEVDLNMGLSLEAQLPSNNESLEQIYEKMESNTKYPAFFKHFNMPCIVPLIPRFDKYPLTYLTKNVHDNKVDLIDDTVTQEEKHIGMQLRI